MKEWSLLFEILRDFWQVLSLIFSSVSTGTESIFSDIFGKGISNIISFCFSCFIDDAIDSYEDHALSLNRYWFTFECIIGIIVFSIFLCCAMTDIGKDSEKITVDEKQKREKSKKTIKYTLLLVTTLYFNILRDSFLILTCDRSFISCDIVYVESYSCSYYYTKESCNQQSTCKWDSDNDYYSYCSGYEHDCSTSESCYGSHNGHIYLCILAVIAILYIIIFVPITINSLIKNHKPKPVFFDASGEYKSQGYTKEDYRQELNKKNALKDPYISLYDGYERDFANYKVIIMIYKIFLLLPAVMILESNAIGGRSSNKKIGYVIARSICIIITMIVFEHYSVKYKPFISNWDSKLDNILRLCAIITSLSTLLLSILNDMHHHIRILIVICIIIIDLISATVSMITCVSIASTFDIVRKQLKNIAQALEFTRYYKTDEPLFLSKAALENKDIDYFKQRKMKIWYSFWDELFATDEKYRIPNKYKTKDNKSTNIAISSNKDSQSLLKNDQLRQRSTVSQTIQEKYKPKKIENDMDYAGYTPPFLEKFDGTIGERHYENKEIVSHESFHSYQSSIEHLIDIMEKDPNVLTNLQWIVKSLQGKDVYWNGPMVFVEQIDSKMKQAKKQQEEGSKLQEKEQVFDEKKEVVEEKKNDNIETMLSNIKLIKNTSSTQFGTLTIVPFPLTAKLIFDEGAISIFSLAPVCAGRNNTGYQDMLNQLLTIVKQNNDQEILRRKNMRLRFRALAGSRVHWETTAFRTKEITRQIEREYIDSDGNRQYRTETQRKNVSVKFYFQYAIFTLKDPGFIITLEYSDGHATYFDEEWHKNYRWDNERHTLHAHEIGITSTYVITPVLQQFLNRNWNENEHSKKMNIIKEEFQQNRDAINRKYIYHEKIMSYAFWYYVYNNDNITLKHLEIALSCEQNPLLKNLFDKHKTIIENHLYFQHLKFYNDSLINAHWYLFWNDIWLNNGQDVKILQLNPNLFNTSPFHQIKQNEGNKNEQCLALNYKQKNELETILNEKGLRGKKHLFRQGWFNDEVLTNLYNVFDYYRENDQIMQNVLKINPMDTSDEALNAWKIKYAKAATLIETIFR